MWRGVGIRTRFRKRKRWSPATAHTLELDTMLVAYSELRNLVKSVKTRQHLHKKVAPGFLLRFCSIVGQNRKTVVLKKKSRNISNLVVLKFQMC